LLNDKTIQKIFEELKNWNEIYKGKLVRRDHSYTFTNVTLLHEHVEGPFEHSFNRECYQKKLKTILKKYKNKNF